jgi:hypothetical protein
MLACCLLVALVSGFTAVAQRGPNTPVWFEGARLIAGDGSAPIEKSAFLVEGDAFAWISQARP